MKQRPDQYSSRAERLTMTTNTHFIRALHRAKDAHCTQHTHTNRVSKPAHHACRHHKHNSAGHNPVLTNNHLHTNTHDPRLLRDQGLARTIERGASAFFLRSCARVACVRVCDRHRKTLNPYGQCNNRKHTRTFARGRNSEAQRDVCAGSKRAHHHRIIRICMHGRARAHKRSHRWTCA